MMIYARAEPVRSVVWRIGWHIQVRRCPLVKRSVEQKIIAFPHNIERTEKPFQSIKYVSTHLVSLPAKLALHTEHDSESMSMKLLLLPAVHARAYQSDRTSQCSRNAVHMLQSSRTGQFLLLLLSAYSLSARRLTWWASLGDLCENGFCGKRETAVFAEYCNAHRPWPLPFM